MRWMPRSTAVMTSASQQRPQLVEALTSFADAPASTSSSPPYSADRRAGRRRRALLAGHPAALAVGAAVVHHQLHPQHRVRARPDLARAAGVAAGRVRQAVLVIVAYSVINLLIQSRLQPKFVGDALGRSVTLTSLVFWTS